MNPLNQIVLTHVLHEMQIGNIERCLAMGLTHVHLAKIQALGKMGFTKLAYSSVPWVNLNIDPKVFERLVEQATKDSEQEQVINRAIKLGATSPMMKECFGLTFSETANRRRILDIPTLRGRTRELSDAQKKWVWKRWKELSAKAQDTNSVSSKSNLLMQLDDAICIAEEKNLSLASVWQELVSFQEHR